MKTQRLIHFAFQSNKGLDNPINASPHPWASLNNASTNNLWATAKQQLRLLMLKLHKANKKNHILADIILTHCHIHLAPSVQTPNLGVSAYPQCLSLRLTHTHPDFGMPISTPYAYPFQKWPSRTDAQHGRLPNPQCLYQHLTHAYPDFGMPIPTPYTYPSRFWDAYIYALHIPIPILGCLYLRLTHTYPDFGMPISTPYTYLSRFWDAYSYALHIPIPILGCLYLRLTHIHPDFGMPISTAYAYPFQKWPSRTDAQFGRLCMPTMPISTPYTCLSRFWDAYIYALHISIPILGCLYLRHTLIPFQNGHPVQRRPNWASLHTHDAYPYALHIPIPILGNKLAEGKPKGMPQCLQHKKPLNQLKILSQ